MALLPPRQRQVRIVGLILAIATAALVGGSLAPSGLAQTQPLAPRSSGIAIPFLANQTKPTDLDFMAAECDIVSNGSGLSCRFRQVFMTISSVDATSCVITTNGYEQTFRRESAIRWISEGAPEGDCGLVETTWLEDGGGTHWALTTRTVATRHLDQQACLAASREPAEVYDWRGVKRALPCTSIQPGAIER